MDEFEIFTNRPSSNGEEYLEKNQIELPTRIINIVKQQYFSSELEFYRFLDEIVNEHTSHFLFPNHLCSFYSKVNEYIASCDTICYLTGAPIRTGESYYVYRPLLQDLNTNKVYTVKKSIQAALGYIDLFPSTLFEFEEWCYKLENAYYEPIDTIDFYDFSTNYGSDVLALRELDRHSNRGKIRKYKKILKELEKEEERLLKLTDTSINPEEIEKKLIKIKEKQIRYERFL